MSNPLSPSQRALVETHLPLVHRIARAVFRAIARRVHIADLEGFGLDGLLRAVRRFDARRGASFATFAGYRIRGAMLDAVRARAREAAAAREAAPDLQRGPLTPVDEVALGGQVLGRVAPALSRLTARELHVVWRVYFDGRDLAGAGAELGLSRSWTSRVHARAILVLRAAVVGKIGGCPAGASPSPTRARPAARRSSPARSSSTSSRATARSRPARATVSTASLA
jgi:RNA polymerase sigma factor (sigma-70 family)